MNKERTKVKDEILNFIHNDKDIKGIFLGGSLALGTEDKYSDIDLRIVINDEQPKMNKLVRIIEHQSDVLFIESLYNSFAVIHFSNFIKVDIFIYYQSELKPSIWLKGLNIIKDTNGFLKTLKHYSEELVYRISQEEFDSLIYKYLANLHELYRRQKRQENHYVQHSFLSMKHCLVSLYHIKSGIIPNSPGDWSKYEGNRSILNNEQKSWLKELSLVNNKEINKYIIQLNKEVEQTAINIAKKEGVTFKRDIFKKACDLVKFQKPN